MNPQFDPFDERDFDRLSEWRPQRGRVRLPLLSSPPGRVVPADRTPETIPCHPRAPNIWSGYKFLGRPATATADDGQIHRRDGQ